MKIKELVINLSIFEFYNEINDINCFKIDYKIYFSDINCKEEISFRLEK